MSAVPEAAKAFLLYLPHVLFQKVYYGWITDKRHDLLDQRKHCFVTEILQRKFRWWTKLWKVSFCNPRKEKGLTSSLSINEVKQAWSGLVHRWVTVHWKVAMHRKTSVPRIGCALVPDNGLQRTGTVASNKKAPCII